MLHCNDITWRGCQLAFMTAVTPLVSAQIIVSVLLLHVQLTFWTINFYSDDVWCLSIYLYILW